MEKLPDEYIHGRRRPEPKHTNTMEDLERMGNIASKMKLTYGQLQQLETLGRWKNEP
jgi:hypothetical protein